MTGSVVIQTTDSRVVVLRQPRRLEVASHVRLAEEEVVRTFSTRMKYRPRNCSTDSLAVEVGVWEAAFSVRALARTKTHALTFIGPGMGQGGFVFNMGGGPGFRVHQMGGGVPRRRPAGSGQAEANPTGLAAFTQLLPLLLIFVLPLLSSLFTGSGSSGPGLRFDGPVKPFTMHRTTPNYNVDYFLNPKEVDGYSDKKLKSLDRKAEVEYVTTLQYQCEHESTRKRQALNDATGFFFTDEAQLRAARAMAMPACERLDDLRRR